MKNFLVALGFASFIGACSGRYHEFPCEVWIDGAFTDDERSAIEASAKTWHDATDGLVEFKVSSSDYRFGDHMILKATLYDAIAANRKPAKNVAGWAHRNVEVGPIAASPGPIYLASDTMESFSKDEGLEYIDLFKDVALHEMGHHIGLAHSDNEKSLMFHTPYFPEQARLIEPCVTAFDVQTFCELYYPDCKGRDVEASCTP